MATPLNSSRYIPSSSQDSNLPRASLSLGVKLYNPSLYISLAYVPAQYVIRRAFVEPDTASDEIIKKHGNRAGLISSCFCFCCTVHLPASGQRPPYRTPPVDAATDRHHLQSAGLDQEPGRSLTSEVPLRSARRHCFKYKT